MSRDIPPHIAVEPQEGETVEQAVERVLGDLAHQGGARVQTWRGETLQEEPLTVYITVEVPLHVAAQFEQARANLSRDKFFTHLLNLYLIRQEAQW